MTCCLMPTRCGGDAGDIAPGVRPVHPSGVRVPWMARGEAMGRLVCRSTILTAALVPIAALSLMTWSERSPIEREPAFDVLFRTAPGVG